MDDAALATALAGNDPQALGEAYRRYADRLFAYARSLVGDRETAADVVQDTFLLAGQHAGQLRDPTRLRAWLYAIARHVSMRQLRSRARVRPVEAIDDRPDETADPLSGMRAAEIAELVWAAYAGIPEGDREIVELSVRHGLSSSDIADMLGMSVKHANARLSRARASLGGALGVLLVARTQTSCPELADLLQGWDGKLTPLLRKRLHRHVEACEICGNVRNRRMDPVALLSGYASAPFAAAPLLARPALPAEPPPVFGSAEGMPGGDAPSRERPPGETAGGDMPGGGQRPGTSPMGGPTAGGEPGSDSPGWWDEFATQPLGEADPAGAAATSRLTHRTEPNTPEPKWHRVTGFPVQDRTDRRRLALIAAAVLLLALCGTIGVILPGQWITQAAPNPQSMGTGSPGSNLVNPSASGEAPPSATPSGSPSSSPTPSSSPSPSQKPSTSPSPSKPPSPPPPQLRLDVIVSLNCVVDGGSEYTIDADASANASLSAATLYWQHIGGTLNSRPMTLSPDRREAELDHPAAGFAPPNRRIRYWIEAQAVDGRSERTNTATVDHPCAP